MAFGSVCGSAPATVAALGRLMHPRLRADGFSDRFSLGLIVSAAETALLIPPSITLIIYGWITETSISRLFAGGLVVGIVLGLVVGKQVGVFSMAWLAIKLGVARLPSGVDLKQIYGAAILCGIGFTMSLFIGMLAFENTAASEVVVTDRLGVLVGSLIAALTGYVVLHFVLPRGRCTEP